VKTRAARFRLILTGIAAPIEAGNAEAYWCGSAGSGYDIRVKRRPRRFILPFNLPALTAMPAALCLVAIALWVRSYWRTDYVERRQESPQLFKAGVPLRWNLQVLKSQRGRLLVGAHWSVGIAADVTLAPAVWTWAHAGKWVDEDDESWWQRMGFFHRQWTFGPGSEGRRSEMVSVGFRSGCPCW
jgi:hypothetical protein